LGIITKSDYFGESEFNETKPREYTAIAYSSEVTLISIEKEVEFYQDTPSYFL